MSAIADSPRPNGAMADREISVSTTGGGATDSGTAPNSVMGDGDMKQPTPAAGAATAPGEKHPPPRQPHRSNHQAHQTILVSGGVWHTRPLLVFVCFPSLNSWDLHQMERVQRLLSGRIPFIDGLGP